jgi:hypothetical protein
MSMMAGRAVHVGGQQLSLTRESVSVSHVYVREQNVCVLQVHCLPGEQHGVGAAHEIGCGWRDHGEDGEKGVIVVGSMKLRMQMGKERGEAVSEQVKEQKERQREESRRDSTVLGRRLFVGGIPRMGYSTPALLSALGVEDDDVVYERGGQEIVLRYTASSRVPFTFVELKSEEAAKAVLVRGERGEVRMGGRSLRLDVAGPRGAGNPQRQQQQGQWGGQQGGGGGFRMAGQMPPPPPVAAWGPKKLGSPKG